MLRSVIKYGSDAELTDRLLMHGQKQYITWIVHSLVDKDHVYDSLYALSEILSLPFTKLRYAYFSSVFLSHGEVLRLSEYKTVMVTLQELHNSPELWRSLERYCYRQLKRLCIEEMVARDETALSIMDKLNASHGLVYKVRSKFIERELKERSKI